jgi:FKBP-type peptidyl-prolyl cis-trans isomerase
MRTVVVSALLLALAACGGKSGTEPTGATETEMPVVKVSDAAAWSKHVPWNSASPDVKKTGSGVEYVVLGSGPASGVAPSPSQQATVFYEGRLNSGGGAFDSAYERRRPETFPVGMVVPGFAEALQLMKPGDHWLVFLPSALGYGAEGAGDDIPPNADLVFEIDMVAVK